MRSYQIVTSITILSLAIALLLFINTTHEIIDLDFMRMERAHFRIPCGQRCIKAEDGTTLLIDEDRTLWMAGWNPRHFQYYHGKAPIVSWSEKAEDIVEIEYRKLHFPETCGSVQGFMVTDVYGWGVTSALRDYQSDILRAMAKNMTLVHRGNYQMCPENPERYLNCFWHDLNGCQASWEQHPDKIKVYQPQSTTVSAVEKEDFPHWLWEYIYMRGHILIRDSDTGKHIHEKDIPDKDQYFQLKVSVLRAIISKRVFRPREHIIARTEDLVQTWRVHMGTDILSQDGITVHIRRTDKMMDLGPHWHHIDFSSTQSLELLIETLQKKMQKTFNHVIIMADDPQVQSIASNTLDKAFRSSPKKLTSNQLCKSLGDNHISYSGHESVNSTQRNELYNIVISEMYAAIQTSDYIVGSGSCGVSQFIAQHLGGKHFVEPSLVAMWEEDVVVHECSWLSSELEVLSKSADEALICDDPIVSKYRQSLYEEAWKQRECDKFSMYKVSYTSSSRQ